MSILEELRKELSVVRRRVVVLESAIEAYSPNGEVRARRSPPKIRRRKQAPRGIAAGILYRDFQMDRTWTARQLATRNTTIKTGTVSSTLSGFKAAGLIEVLNPGEKPWVYRTTEKGKNSPPSVWGAQLQS